MLIGAGIQAAKGALDFALNKKNVSKLRDLENADLISLIPGEKKLSAQILLKQTEHRILSLNNSNRNEIRLVEEEIINLMKENLEAKKEELASQNASQLDVANVLLTIQKFSHESIEEIHQLKQLQTTLVNETQGRIQQIKHQQTILELDTIEKIQKNKQEQHQDNEGLKVLIHDQANVVQHLASSISWKFWFLVFYNVLVTAGLVYMFMR